MIELRRRYSGDKGSGSPSFSRLPAGYQEVEWLVLNTEQGFDTQIPYDDSLNYKCKMRFKIGSHYEQFASPFAAYKGNSYNSFRILIDYINNECYVWANTVSAYPNSTYKTIVDKEFIDIEFSQDECIINGVSAPLESTTRGEPTDNTYFSVGRYPVGAAYRYFSGFIGSIQLSVINQDIAHLIPCYRISDRKPGMYDIVNDVFYINQGTGEFSYGPDVHYNIPPEYQQVEWLKGDGNAYIKTNFIVNSEQEFEITFRIDDFSSIQMLLGISSPYYRLYSHSVGGTNQIEFQYQNNVWNQNIESGEKYVFKKVGHKFYLNNIELPIQLSNNFQSVQDFYIFSCNGELGRYESKNYIYIIKLHDMQFIPCFRKSDNVAGMYDLVSGEFYTNAGTGKFEVGPLVI